MTETAQTGLVARIMDALADMPTTPAIADLGGAFAKAGDQPTAVERRARLALRIALMKRGEFTVTAADVEGPLPEPEEPQTQPEPEPVAEPEPAPFIPAPPPKPPRVSMSTVRLEDAAFLLSAFAAPTDPEATVGLADTVPPKVEAAPVAPETQQNVAPPASAVVDTGDLTATFAAMEPSAPEPEAPPTDTAPTPPAPKAKRKQRPAVPDLAAAAAALAALQASGDEAPESPTPERPEDK